MPSTSDSNTNSLIAFSESLAQIVANVGNSIVAVNRQRFPCSGICWREGLIVTSQESLRRINDLTHNPSQTERLPPLLF